MMMNRKSCLAALAVSTSLIAGCGTDAQFRPRAVGAQAVMPVGDLIASARTDFALNNVALALERFRRASRLQPDNVDALNGIAACYDRMGRFDMSRLYYEKALAIAPNNSKTLHNLQTSLTMQGRKNEALALAREAAPPPQSTVALVSASGPDGVTVALPPLPIVPDTQPSRSPPRPVEPKIAAQPAPANVSPRLERLSLAEVELVTGPDAKPLPTKRPTQAKQADAGRVVRVTRAKRVAQTRTSSEWVFPEAPVTVVTSISAPEPAAVRPAAPKPAAEVAAVAAPSPRPVARAASVPAVAPSLAVDSTAPAAKPPVQLASVAVVAAAPASRIAAPVSPVRSTPAAASPPRAAKPSAASPRAAARRAALVPASRVQVLNAVGRKGLAGRYSQYLKSRGWAELRPADARRRRTATLILYPAGSRAEAAALAKRLPFRAILSPTSRNGSQLLLVLGSDALAFDNRLRLRVARA